MSEFDLDESLNDIALGPEHVGAGQLNHGLYVKFYMNSVLDDAASTQHGRAVYKDVEFVQIMVPGDKNSLIDRPIRLGFDEKSDNQKFAREYALFKENKDQKVDGTPLKEGPPLSKGQIQELAYFNVTTLEQLANLSDTILQKFMGANRLRELARRYLEQAKGGAPLVQMQAELTQRDEQLAAQQLQIDQLVQEMGALRAQAGQPIAVPQTPIGTPPAVPTQEQEPMGFVPEEQPMPDDLPPPDEEFDLEAAEVKPKPKGKRRSVAS